MGPVLNQGWFLAKVPQGTRIVSFCSDSSSCFSQLASLSFTARPSVCGLRLTWHICFASAYRSLSVLGGSLDRCEASFPGSKPVMHLAIVSFSKKFGIKAFFWTNLLK